MGGILSEIEHGTPYRQPVFALLREDPQIATCRPVALSITLVDHLIGEADHGGVASNIDSWRSCSRNSSTVACWQKSTNPSHSAAVAESSPHFSHPVCCEAAIIRPDCVMLRRPPRRTVKVRLRGPRSQALSGRRFRPLATTGYEKCGLEVCPRTIPSSSVFR